MRRTELRRRRRIDETMRRTRRGHRFVRCLNYETLERRELLAVVTQSGGNDASVSVSLSGDGMLVGFVSNANNLVPNDQNNVGDIFVFDRASGHTDRVSVNEAGGEANGIGSGNPSLSGDGRFVAFDSSADNLISGDTNNVQDIFVVDRTSRTIERVSVASDGTEANGASIRPSISQDGRFITFESSATNLVPNDNNGAIDIFVFDRLNNSVHRVSVDNLGVESNGDSSFPSVSDDGQLVAFESSADNLIAGDTNGSRDIFVSNRTSGEIERVSISHDGSEANGASVAATLSGDGRFVAFESDASNLVADDTNAFNDIFVVDRQLDSIERVSVDGATEANESSFFPSISDDGRFVVFTTFADNLIAQDTNQRADVVMVDRNQSVLQRVSINGGSETNGSSFLPSISSSGQMIAFESRASNLVPEDSNQVDDVFVFDQQSAPVQSASLVSIVLTGAQDSVDMNSLSDPVLRTVRTIDIRGTGRNELSVNRDSIVASTPGQNLLILSNPGDEIQFDSDWVFTGAQTIQHEFVRTFVSGGATARIVGPNDWTNPIIAADVNGENGPTARDALNIVNALASNAVNGGSLADEDSFLLDPRTIDPARFRFYDVNRDLKLTARDALNVINFLARIADSNGEPEPIDPSVVLRQQVDADRLAEDLDPAVSVLQPVEDAVTMNQADRLDVPASADPATASEHDGHVESSLRALDHSLAQTWDWLRPLD